MSLKIFTTFQSNLGDRWRPYWVSKWPTEKCSTYYIFDSEALRRTIYSSNRSYSDSK